MTLMIVISDAGAANDTDGKAVMSADMLTVVLF